MHTATPQVIAALNHVRTFLPEVTQVFYTVEQKWLYMTDEGESPAFGDMGIDTSVLEDAADSLTCFPVAFHYTTPVAEETERDGIQPTAVPTGFVLLPVKETPAMHDAVMSLLYKGVARHETQTLLDAYIAAAKSVPAKAHGCTWTRDEDTGTYDTGCGRTWSLTDGGHPEEHGQYYCHHCGKPIIEAEASHD